MFIYWKKTKLHWLTPRLLQVTRHLLVKYNTGPKYLTGLLSHLCVHVQRRPAFIPDMFHLQPGHPCRHNPTECLSGEQWQAFLMHISFHITLYSPKGSYSLGGYWWAHTVAIISAVTADWKGVKNVDAFTRGNKSQWLKRESEQQEIHMIDWTELIEKYIWEWNISFIKPALYVLQHQFIDPVWKATMVI